MNIDDYIKNFNLDTNTQIKFYIILRELGNYINKTSLDKKEIADILIKNSNEVISYLKET